MPNSFVDTIQDKSRDDLLWIATQVFESEQKQFLDRLKRDLCDFLREFSLREINVDPQISLTISDDENEDSPLLFSVQALSSSLTVKLAVEVTRASKNPAFRLKDD